jgi:hypothetical protein
MLPVPDIGAMNRNGLVANIKSGVCDRQGALVAYLAVCITLSVLSLYSVAVLDRSASAYVLAQLNLLVLGAFVLLIVGLLYICNRT